MRESLQRPDAATHRACETGLDCESKETRLRYASRTYARPGYTYQSEQRMPTTSSGLAGGRAGQPELFAHAQNGSRARHRGRTNRMVFHNHHLRDWRRPGADARRASPDAASAEGAALAN